jgi:hypothetical protein
VCSSDLTVWVCLPCTFTSARIVKVQGKQTHTVGGTAAAERTNGHRPKRTHLDHTSARIVKVQGKPTHTVGNPHRGRGAHQSRHSLVPHGLGWGKVARRVMVSGVEPCGEPSAHPKGGGRQPLLIGRLGYTGTCAVHEK